MSPIGVFDSGYGGLTILKEFVKQLPQNDFLYLGDNARAPYGSRSFETVYHYTRQCVRWMFDQGCPLVILACNTASAKALRTIQQRDLPLWDKQLRVLGVIRPTAELIGMETVTKRIGILATRGTVLSESYMLEIKKFFPEMKVYQQACPLWVPIIESNLMHTPGAEYFFRQDIDTLMKQDNRIDAVLLGCTHYPLIQDQIQNILPAGVTILSQGPVVASQLVDYLQRHPGMDARCTKNGSLWFCTTDSAQDFSLHSSLFFGKIIQAKQIELA